MAGDFPVTVIGARGSNGNFTGEGYIVVPYLGNTKLKVVFNSIQINTERQLIGGVIETTYDPSETEVYEVDVIKSVGDLLNDLITILSKKNPTDEDQKQFEEIGKQLEFYQENLDEINMSDEDRKKFEALKSSSFTASIKEKTDEERKQAIETAKESQQLYEKYKEEFEKVKDKQTTSSVLEVDNAFFSTDITGFGIDNAEGIEPSGKIIKKIQLANVNHVAVYSISPNLNYLVTGITIYGKQNKKAEIDLYTAKYDENGVFINYTNAEDKKLDDIATIEYAESGNVIIRKLLHDKTCFYYQKVINWNAIKATTAKQLSDSLEEKWNGITKEEEKLLYNADTSCTVINSIVSLIEKDKEEACTSTKQIEDNKAVKVFFEQPSYTVDELLEFIVDKAICLESLKTAPYQKLKEAFVKVGSQASIKDKKEITLLRLIAAIKSSDYSDFIETLEGKDKKNTLLFNILKNVDDATLGFYGGNHFTSFIGSLVHIYEKNSDLWINRMQNIEDGRLFGQVISLDPVKYTVSKDVGFFNNNIYEFGEARFRGKLRADQKIQISREKGYVLQNGSSNWLPDNDYPSISLAPLDPVTILTKENIDLVKESLQGTTRTLEGKYVVPALFLEYQTDKEFKKATADGLMNTLDVITIATGGAGLATKIGWIPRIWALAEIAGAGGNLLVNNTDITKNSPKTTAVINSYNFVMGVIGVKNMVVGIKNIVPNLKTGVKNAVKEGKDLTNVEDLAKATDDFKKELSALKNSSEWNHLDTKVKQQILKQEEFVDIFVKEKVIVTDAIRKSWNGARNIFEATAEEIAEATTKIKNHRISTGNLKGGNYGYLDGSVNGKSIENKMWRSGNVIEGEPQIFEAMKVSGNSGNTWLRNTDSEYKMLNKLADDLGGVSGGKYPNVIGELKIISENPYCASCTGIIQQFNEMYPNVKLILIDGAK